MHRIRAIPKLPRRRPDAHKGDFGRVLVLAGSVGMSGAPALVALGALRSGAGLVTIAVPNPIQRTVTVICPCATTIGLPESEGQIDAGRAFTDIQDALDGRAQPNVVVTGPGVGQGDRKYADEFWEMLGIFSEVPLVADADALNLTYRSDDRHVGAAAWNRPHSRIVITPHPGELARMHGVSTRDVQADREGFAARTADMLWTQDEGSRPEGERPVVVLKGAGTIVTNGESLYVNRTGNPGMATGGSGDVLAGVIGALIGQGLSCLDAAVFGVYVHGLAGDLAARRLGQVSLIATDIVEALPQAFQRAGSKRR